MPAGRIGLRGISTVENDTILWCEPRAKMYEPSVLPLDITYNNKIEIASYNFSFDVEPIYFDVIKESGVQRESIAANLLSN